MSRTHMHAHMHAHYTKTVFHFLIHPLLIGRADSLTGVAEGLLCASELNEEGLRLVSILYVTVIDTHKGAPIMHLHWWIWERNLSKSDIKKCKQ